MKADRAALLGSIDGMLASIDAVDREVTSLSLGIKIEQVLRNAAPGMQGAMTGHGWMADLSVEEDFRPGWRGQPCYDECECYCECCPRRGCECEAQHITPERDSMGMSSLYVDREANLSIITDPVDGIESFARDTYHAKPIPTDMLRDMLSKGHLYGYDPDNNDTFCSCGMCWYNEREGA